MKKIFIIMVLVLTATCLLIHLMFTRYTDHTFPYACSDIVSKSLDDGILEGSFYVKVDKPINKVILVRFAIPKEGIDGLGRRNASKMVFYAPYNGDDIRIVKGLIPWHRNFAETFGYSVFTFTIKADGQSAADDEYYVFHENGWGEVVFALQRFLQVRYNLKPQKLIIVGESSGGSFAQQLVARYPERIECAAWNGGKIYAPFQKNTNCRLMATSIWGCPGCNPTDEMCIEAKALGIDIKRYVTPPNIKRKGDKFEHHAAGPLNFDLLTAFVVGIDYSDILAQLPPRDFARKNKYIFLTPKSPKEATILITDFPPDDKTELHLMDKMWYLYNDGHLVAYVNKHLANEDDSRQLIKQMENSAKTLHISLKEKELKL